MRAAASGKRFAATIGFPPLQCEEVGLVVTEIASNLVRHASGGRIIFAPASEAERFGIEIQSLDNGPGIQNVEQAIVDGYSTAGGLGLGLGTINRLMDELEFSSTPKGGLHLRCRRWLQQPQSSYLPTKELEFGAATRSYHQYPENGDTFIFRQWNQHALLGVIDGLGHGQFAQRASQTARQYVEQHFDQSLENLFRGVGRACRSTRGVVMALARFDLMRNQVTVASVGNVEVRMVGNSQKFSLIVRRGIIGMNAPNPVPASHPWTSSNLLIMHSDGLHTHWNWQECSDLMQEAPPVIAQQLLSKFGKVDDDATIVVVRSAA